MSDITKLETFLPCTEMDQGILRESLLKDLRTRMQHTKKMARVILK